MSQSTTAKQTDKPAKPYMTPIVPACGPPLGEEGRGESALLGICNFVAWEAPNGAFKKYLHDEDYLHNGRKQPVNLDGRSEGGLSMT